MGADDSCLTAVQAREYAEALVQGTLDDNRDQTGKVSPARNPVQAGGQIGVYRTVRP